jgi:hypothetical protein
MSQGARLLRCLDGEAEHARELPACLQLELDGDGGDVLDDVVGVVERGDQLRDESGKEQIGHHVPEVPGVERGHRSLERGGELVELVASPRQPVQVGPGVLVMGADGGLILRMEVAAPEDVVPHQLEQGFLEEVVVLPVGAQEEGGERIRHAPRALHPAYRRIARTSGREGAESARSGATRSPPANDWLQDKGCCLHRGRREGPGPYSLRSTGG